MLQRCLLCLLPPPSPYPPSGAIGAVIFRLKRDAAPTLSCCIPCACVGPAGMVASDYLTRVCGCRPLAHGENLAEWMVDFLTMVRGAAIRGRQLLHDAGKRAHLHVQSYHEAKHVSRSSQHCPLLQRAVLNTVLCCSAHTVAGGRI